MHICIYEYTPIHTFTICLLSQIQYTCVHVYKYMCMNSYKHTCNNVPAEPNSEHPTWSRPFDTHLHDN